jgi:hypothetical protein
MLVKTVALTPHRGNAALGPSAGVVDQATADDQNIKIQAG